MFRYFKFAAGSYEFPAANLLTELRRTFVRISKLLVVLCFCGLSGCSYLEQYGSSVPDYENIGAYDKIELKESDSADVLELFSEFEDELLSQSKSVIAAQGQKKGGHQIWLNMVAFDENELTAKRKCFFRADEKAQSMLIWYRRKLDFKITTVLGKELFEEPYANENARQIAILKEVLKETLLDADQVAPDNRMINICGTLINQTLGTVLQKLDTSPVLALKLGEEDGLEFDHITFGEGRIRMNIAGDIVEVKVRNSSYTWTGEDPFALEE